MFNACLQWNWAAELLPLWLAPNLVTLIGFGFILVNVLTLVLVMPDLAGPGPSWMYYSFAAGLWMYVSFFFSLSFSFVNLLTKTGMAQTGTRQWIIWTGSKLEEQEHRHHWGNYLSEGFYFGLGPTITKLSTVTASTRSIVF